MNTTEFLTISSAIVPQREALVFEERRNTYQQLADRVNRLANALADLGVKAGDRVALLHVNCHQYIEAYFATAKLDAIFVPLNFRAKADELTHMLHDASPRVLLAGERYVASVNTLRPRLPGVEHYVALESPSGQGWHFHEDLLSLASDADLTFPQASDEDTTVLMYTAGTTGMPKGVMLSHNSFSSYILSQVTPADPDIEERNLLTVPLYHIAGLQAALAAVYGGRTLIIQRQFEPKEWMELVEREGANRAMVVPTMLQQLMDHPDFHRHNLSSLEVITYGASSMPLEVIKQAIREFPGTRFINAFGQTETASTITMLPPQDHVLEGSPQEIEKKLKRLTSIGRPLEDVEVLIADEEGREVPVGQVGEIVARGERLMKGYWHQQETTTQRVRGGWLYTGDLGYSDEDGYIYLAGRAKDFIKRGGEMISPEEVEQVLHSHPQVQEAAIIGIPDAQWGERVRAIVVPKPGHHPSEEEIIEYCHQRLASYKRPESVVFAEELPRGPLDKVLKRVLRKQYGSP